MISSFRMMTYFSPSQQPQGLQKYSEFISHAGFEALLRSQKSNRDCDLAIIVMSFEVFKTIDSYLKKPCYTSSTCLLI